MASEPYESSELDPFISDEIKARIAVARGVTVTSVAEALDLRRPVLSDRVNGRAPFSSALLDKVARHLGTTASAVMAAAERRRRQSAEAGSPALGAADQAVSV